MALETRETLFNSTFQKCFLAVVDISELPQNVSMGLDFTVLQVLKHTCVTRKQMFILERADLSGTTLYDSGCESSAE